MPPAATTPPSSSKPITVVFLLSYPRSGSTILGKLLNNLPGYFFAGEVRYLWERGLGRGSRCGCGAPVPSCPFWGPLARRLHGVNGSSLETVGRSVARWQEQHMGSSRLPWLLTRRAPTPPAAYSGYVQLLGRLYNAAADRSESSVVIDSSKWPMDAALLRWVPGIRPVLAHLVRDPRGVAYSRQRRQDPDPGGPALRARRTLLAYDALGWAALNAAGEALSATMPTEWLTYEQFTACPSQVVDQVTRLAGRPHEPVGIDGADLELAENHVVAGNRNRFGTGRATLRSDAAWTRRLRRSDRMLVEGLTWPLRRRYGYPTGNPHA